MLFGSQLYETSNLKTASKVSNCDFIANSASTGGGLYYTMWLNAFNQINNNEKQLTIDGCNFRENTADLQGGGLYLLSSFRQDITVEIVNTTISKNSSGEKGGGVFSYLPNSFLTPLKVKNCVLDNNSAQESGGAFAVNNSLIINGSTLSNNSAEMYGGAFYLEYPGRSLSIKSCTVISNSAGERGGEIYANSQTNRISVSISNSILAGNLAPEDAQLTYESHIYTSIIQESTEGLIDPVLRDNGGPTKTHALLPGSVAINAGDNSAASDAELSSDQRGSGFARIVDGTVDIGAFEVQSPFTQVDLRIIDSKTPISSNGESSSLPDNLTWINEWSGYWLEIWISTPTSTDLSIQSAALELSYNTAITTATSIEYGAAFSENQTGTINDLTGTIENLSAETTLTGVGDDQRVLLARIRFESTSDDAVDLYLAGPSLNAKTPGFEINQPEILFTGNAASEEIHGPALETQIYANPYDLNDDGVINFRDLVLFASAYRSIPSESGLTYSWFSDFNQSDRVDFRDLILFASNYGKSKASQSTINYAPNFPDAWNQLLTVESPLQPSINANAVSQSTADTMLNSVVERVSPQLTLSQTEILNNIDIQVVDLEGDILGRAVSDTIYSDTIYIDVNAAGQGWFVDDTPLDHSEFTFFSELTLIAIPDSEAADGVDLWTVILHEMGHLLGYEHEAAGIMQEILAPGERYLPAWEEDADSFFLDIQSETELLPF